MGTTLDNIRGKKGQKVMFLNVRSLHAHLTELQLDFSDSDFMCIGFCETWLLEASKSSMLTIKGYYISRLDRLVNKRGGGVIFYIRDDLVVENLINIPSVSNADIENLNIVLRRPYQNLSKYSIHTSIS